jgi:hypothetical protein
MQNRYTRIEEAENAPQKPFSKILQDQRIFFEPTLVYVMWRTGVRVLLRNKRQLLGCGTSLHHVFQGFTTSEELHRRRTDDLRDASSIVGGLNHGGGASGR